MASPWTRKIRWAVLIAATIVLTSGASKGTAAAAPRPSSQAPTSQAPATAAVVLGGQYSDLHAEQKRLVDDWFRRLSSVIKKEVSPEEGYNNLPLSSKTTFSAITHALLRTPLTDSSGVSLGNTALTLVGGVDELFGKVEGSGGDRQFRIYVSLKPGALEILEKSNEFDRKADNTVFHKGFPICYRSTGGTPSIQFSMTRDGKRADIDVDYRSSSFPVALFNGHLNSANSDIRAGNNDERHNNQWEGVSSWWRGLLGLPLLGARPANEENVAGGQNRTKSNARPASAVHDFLQAWLVERKPEEAVTYFSDAALACMEIEQGQPKDRGVARFEMLMGLRQINESMGPITDLSQAVASTAINNSRVKFVDQPHKNQFILYDVREDLAEKFNCVNRLDPTRISPNAARSTAFGKYFGAVFYLKSPKGIKGEVVLTLWSKQNNQWKLISYSIEPEHEATPPVVPDSIVRVESVALAQDAGDKQLLAAATDFLQKWFIRRRINEAFRYLSTRAYSCVDAYRSEAASEPASPNQAPELIQKGMDQITQFAGSARRLGEAIVSPQLFHPDMKLVKHPDSAAFALVAIPDSMALYADCSGIKRGEELGYTGSQSAAQSYGQYYAAGFRMIKATNDPPVLWLVWAREDNQWKIVAYHILTP